MNDENRNHGADGELEAPDEKNPRDRQGFKENPAIRGLKTPPPLEPGEDSGEWTRGGGSDPEGPRRDS
jgi:hypothetical protein